MKRPPNYFAREWIFFSILILVGFAILGKLFYLQIINASELVARGATFHVNSQAMIYERGMIEDAQGNILAKSVTAKDIYADPRTLKKTLLKGQEAMSEQELMEKITEISKSLADILAKKPQDITALLTKDLSWVSLARQVDRDKAQKIASLNIAGIGFTDTYKRFYPTGMMASSVLGIVNLAGNGVEGVEYSYNAELNGEKELKPLDGSTPSGPDEDKGNVKAGYNLTLTLDSTIQHVIEQELDDIIAESSPQRAVILAMDPMSGKILGMGSRPHFDPNKYGESEAQDRKNLAIQMIYEPGSTFKIVTGAAALEENVVHADQIFNDPGYLIVGSRKITNWDSDLKAHGPITFAEGMKLSSNVVLAKVGEALGKDAFDTYLKSFGFGTKTKIDMAAEERGLLIDKSRVKDLELATMAFGQANLVTPVQLLTAVCAVANGGTLYQPYIVDKVTNQDRKVLWQNTPRVTREVISQRTARTMTNILVDVVDKGTGGKAKIQGIKVAGKTGTAQKIDPETGRYSDTDFIASFVAYAPADKPRIAVLVVLDTPQGEIIQGGTLAGPHAKNIMESTLQYYGIPVAASTPSKLTELSNPHTPSSPEKPAVKPNTPALTPGRGEALIPDLPQMTLRQAGEALGKQNLKFEFIGSGFAIDQQPAAGRIANQGDVVTVTFKARETQPLRKDN